VKAFSARGRPPTRQIEVMRLLAGAWPMPMHIEQVACELGISTGHSWTVLRYMDKAGRAVKCGPALYGSARIRP
jgi:hypothetical protein